MLGFWESYFEARKKFSPIHLSKHLLREKDGTVYVNREKMIQSKDDARLFSVALDYDYRWDFDDFEHSTVYFEICGDTIKGGVYNTLTREKKTRWTVVSREPKRKVYHYSYSTPDFTKVCEAIRKA